MAIEAGATAAAVGELVAQQGDTVGSGVGNGCGFDFVGAILVAALNRDRLVFEQIGTFARDFGVAIENPLRGWELLVGRCIRPNCDILGEPTLDSWSGS